MSERNIAAEVLKALREVQEHRAGIARSGRRGYRDRCQGYRPKAAGKVETAALGDGPHPDGPKVPGHLRAAGVTLARISHTVAE